MRLAVLVGASLAVVATARSASAQVDNVDMVVIVPEVEVRSGGTSSFYATNKLRYGQIVHVVRESKEFPGWLAIKPPPGSFSWINARFVEETGPYLGKIVTDPDAQVPVYPGSLISNQTPNVEIVKLGRGSIVTILPGPPNYTSTGKWIPIAPTPLEVRYLPASAVKRADAGQLAANQTHRVGTATGSISYNQPLPAGHPHHTTSMSGSNWTPTGSNVTLGPPTGPYQTTYSNASQPKAGATSTRWSEYGILRRTSCQKDGRPLFALLNRRGEVFLYATSGNNALDPYVNRLVCLYGQVSYSSDRMVRNYCMNATHVAVP